MNEELKNVIKNLKISYHSGHGDNLGKDFYSPLLAKCKQYKRDTGDFTSTVIFDWGEALLNVINRDDEECVIKLIANPKLNDEDFETLSQVVENKDREEYLDKIGRNILDEAFSLSQGTAERKIKLKIFAYLVTTNKLIIKFGFPRHVRGANIYHPKSGVFYFDNDIKVGFIGGSNETHGGHLTNIEYIQVHNNLEENNKYLDDVEEKFDIGWKNLAPGFQTCALNQDTLKKIKSYAPKSKQELKQEIEKYNTENKPKLGEHLSDETKQKLNQIKEELVLEDYLKIIEEKWRFQERARLKFIEKKWGLLEMATGTGKTRIALAIATQLINENKIDKIIIQMKGVDLIKQWVGNIDEWRNSKISREVNFLADERDDRDFFLGNFNNPDVDLLLIRQSRLPDLLDKIKDYDQKKTLIIHDEVHDLFAEEISEKILGKQKKFGYKLGLSATIREEFDKARERKLFEEIQGGGDKPAFEYSINDAIADEVLVEMDLIHLEYELDEEEKSKISEKYGIYKKNIDEGMPKWQAESIRNMSIADVKKNAKDKIVVFRNNLSKLLPKLKRSFIFADECDYGDILVNILVPHLNVKTHYNDNKTDKDNLKRFSNKEIDCIINVLKLSQGIDIQSLDTVVLFATPKGRQLIQRLGRVLRIDPNNRNKKAVVIDFFEKKEMKNKKGSEYNRYLQLKEYSKIKKRNL